MYFIFIFFGYIYYFEGTWNDNKNAKTYFYYTSGVTRERRRRVDSDAICPDVPAQ